MPSIPGWASFAELRARIRSLHRSLSRHEQVDDEMNEEFAHHLAMRTDDLVRQGIAPSEAARRARIEFGHPANHRADAREARGLRHFDRLHVSWLDVKLAFRMLIVLERAQPAEAGLARLAAHEPSTRAAFASTVRSSSSYSIPRSSATNRAVCVTFAGSFGFPRTGCGER